MLPLEHYHTDITAGEESGLLAEDTALLKALAYFDLFNYPLLPEELRHFAALPISPSNVAERLSALVAAERIYCLQGYYSLQNNPLLVHRRKQGNERAALLIEKAQRIGKWLYRFPFVRGICISGSLSKQFAQAHDDIDFFIITRRNRLWIARTAMHLFKKLSYLTGKQHYLCMNYYIDEDALLIPEQNIFTAVEICTLLPVCGLPVIRDFAATNAWTNSFLPMATAPKTPERDARNGIIKNTMEWLLGGKLGQWIENGCYQLTRRRWAHKVKQEKRNAKGARMSLLTGRHFSKSNPGDFQEKVLALYQQKWDAVIQKA